MTARRLLTALPTVVALLLVAAYTLLFMWLVMTTQYDTWGAALYGPLLLIGSIPLLRLASRGEDDLFFWVLFAGLTLKLLSSLVNHLVAEELYAGIVDANRYALEGERLARAYRQGEFTADLGRQFMGTGALRAITGILFAVTGRTSLGGAMIFSWWAFWGLVGFYKAFRHAVPNGDHQRYALLIFFMPSLLFWPSTIGKDAWMLLGLGTAAYGCARLLSRGGGALLPLTAGIAATAIVRPHIALLVCAALLASYLFRPTGGRPSYLGPLGKPAGALILAALTFVLVQQAERYLGVEDDQSGGAIQALDKAADRTATGGSNFDAVNARSLTDIPAAVVAVLFRPFPWEARSAQAMISSVEGVVLCALVVISRRRYMALPRLAQRRPYLVLVAVYTVLFCVAFSSFGNFGILTRQRVQLLPFAFTLLALPTARQRHAVIDLADADRSGPRPHDEGLAHQTTRQGVRGRG